jgi:hypothetical protein
MYKDHSQSFKATNSNLKQGLYQSMYMFQQKKVVVLKKNPTLKEFQVHWFDPIVLLLKKKEIVISRLRAKVIIFVFIKIVSKSKTSFLFSPHQNKNNTE